MGSPVQIFRHPLASKRSHSGLSFGGVPISILLQALVPGLSGTQLAVFSGKSVMNAGRGLE